MKHANSLAGPGLVLLFCVSQAFRDVFFGHAFQGIDFFTVILIAFALSTAIFVAIPLLRAPRSLSALRRHWISVVVINVTTAVAWSSYFGALTRIEPSIVNTIHSGMGPLTVLALGALGIRIAKAEAIGWGEYFGYAGMALSMAALWWVVLSGHSGMALDDPARALTGLALLLMSGTSITVSLLTCKRLHDRGVSPEAVTAVRYLLLIAVAAVVVGRRGGFGGIASASEAAALAVLAVTLIVLPLYALQIGTALTAPLTANVLRSLGPVFVFALQQADARLAYAPATLVCILAYSAAAVVASVAHGLHRAGASNASTKNDTASAERPRAAQLRPPAAAAAATGLFKPTTLPSRGTASRGGP